MGRDKDFAFSAVQKQQIILTLRGKRQVGAIISDERGKNAGRARSFALSTNCLKAPFSWY